MVSQLEATWKKLHPTPVQVKEKPVAPVVTPTAKPVHPVAQTPTYTQTRVQPKPEPVNTVFNIDTGNGIKSIWIPNAVKDVFFNEAQLPENNDLATVEDVFFNEAQLPENNDLATVEDVAHVAMLLFVGYVDAATSMSESCGGGGGSPQSGWSKKDDEDDREYARRCLQISHSMCRPMPKPRRGYHR